MTFNGRDGPADTTEWYLAALNSHGNSKFRLLLTPVRIVCANTQSAAIAGAQHSFGIPHISNADTAIAQARNALRLPWRYIEAFETEAAALYAAAMNLAVRPRVVRGGAEVRLLVTVRRSIRAQGGPSIRQVHELLDERGATDG